MTKLAFGVVAGLLANLVQANTVSIVDIFGDALTPGTGIQYTASCGDSTDLCIQGFFGTSLTNTALDSNQATGFELDKSNETTELLTLNTLLPASPLDEVSYINKIDIAESSFTTNREYFSIKQSKWTVFFANLTGGSVTVNFNAGDLIDFSHYTEYGGLSAVPLPAAAPLFGSAIGLIGFLGWLKHKKTAAQRIRRAQQGLGSE